MSGFLRFRGKVIGILPRSLIWSFLTIVTCILLGSPACNQIPEATSSLVRAVSVHPSYIKVDQFGYRPIDSKVAVIVESNAATKSSRISSLLMDNYQLVRQEDATVWYEAKAQLWQTGEVHNQSGDRAAWFDFSTVQQPGSYFIQNARTGDKSPPFKISDDVYRNALVAATRMFFYQRSGFPKHQPYADARWTDDAAFLGSGQDTEARFIDDKDNADLALDLQGGWFDAGDTNKYVTFATQPVHQLLDAYSQNPSIWTDDFNLPESGNGIPDLLDEIEFELQWLRRMQDDDGGVFIKVGAIENKHFERPSLDPRHRFYGPKCSSSTIALSSMFAHGAVVFSQVPSLQSRASELQSQAQLAWHWFHSHPMQTDCDHQEIRSGDADKSTEQQRDTAVSAAVYLFTLTGDQSYEDYISQNLTETRPYHDLAWSLYQPFVGDALLNYTQLAQGSSDLRQKILRDFNILIDRHPELYGQAPSLDPYWAYMPDDQYHWGSNQVKSNLGNTNYDAVLYRMNPNQSANYRNRALDNLHYLHGVNPLGMVYITNMYDYGATYAANEMFHEWFGAGIYSHARSSPSGPAPGFVTGGPNKNYTGSAPIGDLPIMKIYLDSNQGWDVNTWELSEPAIYYQSAYLKLLSKFVGS
jgi:endoglucanase